MDVLSIVITVSGVTLGLLSGGATFYNKQRFTGQIDLLRNGNDELRNQNQDLRNERTDLEKQIAAYKARTEEKERIIADLRKQPSFKQLVKLLSNNHKEVMAALGVKHDK
jgi:uncharacterized protein YlxW (UPF0749 family)